MLEFSAVVWHSSLSQANTSDIERIQKSAVKIILKHKYKDYDSALKELNLETLQKRREILCLRFAKKSLKLNNFKKMFPLSKKLHSMKQRKGRKFLQKHANTERYIKSSIPYMQRLLNLENNKLKNFESSVYDCPSELYLFDKDAITVDNLN